MSSTHGLTYVLPSPPASLSKQLCDLKHSPSNAPSTCNWFHSQRIFLIVSLHRCKAPPTFIFIWSIVMFVIEVAHEWPKDSEVYRQVVKKQVRLWMDSVLAKKNQEWLIFFVTRDIKARFMKGSVLDKLKSDFNSARKDRYLPPYSIHASFHPILYWCCFLRDPIHRL